MGKFIKFFLRREDEKDVFSPKGKKGEGLQLGAPGSLRGGQGARKILFRRSQRKKGTPSSAKGGSPGNCPDLQKVSVNGEVSKKSTNYEIGREGAYVRPKYPQNTPFRKLETSRLTA